MSVLALIPARGGSKRIPRKNLREVGGVTLVARAIACAHDAGIADVLVSTDDDEIARHAEACGARAGMRPACFATDGAPLEPTIGHAIASVDAGVQFVVVLQPTSPLRRPEHVRAALDLLRTGESDTVVSVYERADVGIFGGRFKRDEYEVQRSDGVTVGRWLHAAPETGQRPPTQKLPRMWIDAGAIYAMRVAWFRKHGVRYGGKVGAVLLDEWSAIDVDTERDLAFAEWALQRREWEMSASIDPKVAGWVSHVYEALSLYARVTEADIEPSGEAAATYHPWASGFASGECLSATRHAFSAGILLAYLHRLSELDEIPVPARPPVVERAPSLVDPLREATTLARSKALIESFYRHLPETRWPCATRMGQPLAGHATVVCGAGPSLAAALPHLREHRQRITVIAANTAVPALRAGGVDPDVVVTLEIIDVSKQLIFEPVPDAPKPICVLDLSACDESWRVAKDLYHPVWLCPPPQYALPLAETLHAPPLSHAGNVGTAAVALALTWGADPLLLVGLDCAYPGGKAYAPGTPWESVTVGETPAGDRRLTFGGSVERDAIHAKHGMPPANAKERLAVMVPQWGGGEHVPTTTEYVHQLDWFADCALAWGPIKELYDCGGPGTARKQGWNERSIAGALASLQGRTPSGLEQLITCHGARHFSGPWHGKHREALERIRDRVRAEIAATRDAAAQLAEPTADVHRLAAVLGGIPTVEGLLAPIVLRARREGGGMPPTKLAQCLREAADQAEAMLK